MFPWEIDLPNRKVLSQEGPEGVDWLHLEKYMKFYTLHHTIAQCTHAFLKKNKNIAATYFKIFF